MEISIDTEKFLITSRNAYYKFQKQQIPFAAVKLYFSGLGGERTKVDDIVGNNFRSEKDSILKTKNNYAILMHNTSCKAAEAVMNRISIELSRLSGQSKILTKPQQINAYACIYGTGEEESKLQFRHLDLINPSENYNKGKKNKLNIGEYLRWTQPMGIKGYKSFSIKV